MSIGCTFPLNEACSSQHGVVGIGNNEAVARGLERELGLLPARCETDEHDPSVSVDVVEGRIVDSKAVAVSEG